MAMLTAQYVSTNTDGTVVVDFGQGPLTIYAAGFTTPLPGAYVRTLRVNGLTMMLGSVKPQSAYGRVVATGVPKLTVQLPDASEVQLGYLSTYATPAVDDDVLIMWDGGGIVIGPLAEIPESAYVPPSAVPVPVQYTTEFLATDSGTFYVPGGQWNSNDVWSSLSNAGAWWFNDIAGTIPDGASIVLVETYVTEIYNQHPAVLAKVGLHSHGGKAGNPGIRDAADISAGTGWKTLPNAFGDALKTGAAIGIGVPTVPGGTSYHRYQGRSADVSSGKLRITYVA
ncbi:hypothetical protein E3O55_08520 [Cryobacterium sp. MDB1-18-2]|uniref:hypothetical protein n=1 Tax=Cryobacterium sp. MDB1-18-2 TaxID=1259169 RepID=UPI00106D3740|nr:hypothetical protein [Cryobacterium sp. MDB1-18-2]TFC30117.1 hypothetical protein E3O55_08520 [Cryobacterium sp. MDB1-18-2]TFC41397.1 hypothetical protein E3O50_09960 [Cryobacterium sp. MDB1-18-1]